MHPLTYIGFALILIAALSGAKQYNFINSSKSSDGFVTAIDTKIVNRSQKGRHKNLAGYKDEIATITFETNLGQKLEFQTSSGFSTTGLKTGDKVTVIYNPQNPNEAKVKSGKFLYGFSIISFLLGCLLLALGKKLHS